MFTQTRRRQALSVSTLFLPATKNTCKIYMYMYVYMYSKIQCVHVREMKKKEERSKQGQTNNKAKQHSTPKAVTFPKKNELGLEPVTLYTLDRVHYHLNYTCTVCACMYIHVYTYSSKLPSSMIKKLFAMKRSKVSRRHTFLVAWKPLREESSLTEWW